MQSDQIEPLQRALAGRYEVGRELGRGGMATVYLARDLRHDREVALKVFRPEVAQLIGVDRFRREIDLAARLSHPHILPLHDSGEAEGLLFYVMPYVRGESLRQVIEREGQLSVNRAVELTRQVAAALTYAHARGVVHRDIKPENILLHEGEAMVADLGIALAATPSPADRLTETGLSLGTPHYMSPEQALGEREIDGRSDLYSLACVLYEMLAGRPPFDGASALAVTAKRLSEPAPDIRRLRAAVPPVISRTLARALERQPHDRYDSVAAFAQALTEAPVSESPEIAVAILPFRNLSADPENEYFADGITEDIIAQISKVTALRVTSRASVMPFKQRTQPLREIAATLHAATLLDGSVRRFRDRVRIVAELIDARTDEQLWADTYDRELTDVFAIQSDVALCIASALRAELSSDEASRIVRPPTRDVHAYQLYLQGRHCLVRYTTEGMNKAVTFFEQALAIDPDYALAQVGIGVAFVELAETGSTEPAAGYRRARQAIDEALRLDETLSEAHSALGMIKVTAEFDWTGAEREFRRALELNPSSAETWDLYSRMCGSLGRFDEAVAMGRRAQELDPLVHRADLATNLLRAGRLEEALAEAERAVEFDPNYDRIHATLGWAYMLNGRYAEGLAELERAVALSPESRGWQSQLAQAQAMAGDPEAARRILDELLARRGAEYISPYHLAYVYTGLGEYDAAMDCLEEAYEKRAGAVYGVAGSFLFTALRTHPRFEELLRKLNLR